METREIGLLWNTCLLFLATACLAIPIALVTLQWSKRAHPAVRRCCDALMWVGLFIPLYSQVTAWEAGFGRGGWFSIQVLREFSMPPLFGFRGAVWVHAMAAIPWGYWILALKLSRREAIMERLARTETSPLRVWRYVKLPLAVPALVAAMLYIAIVTSTEITATDVYQFRTFAEEIYYQFMLGVSWAKLPLEVAPLAVLLGALAIAGGWLAKSIRPVGKAHLESTRFHSSAVASFMITLILCVLFALPLGNLVYQLGLDAQMSDGIVRRSWSVRQAAVMLAAVPGTFRRELAWSMLLGQLVAISTVGAAFVSAAWAWQVAWRRAFVFVLAVGCFIFPAPLLGVALIALFRQTGIEPLIWLYDHTLAAPWLALCLRSYPWCLAIVAIGFQALDRRAVQLARQEGASNWKLWSSVLLPQMNPYLRTALLVGFAVAVGELSCSVLLLPPGVTTVSSRIFNLVHYGAEADLAGLCLIATMMMSIVSWMTIVVAKRVWS